MGLGSGCDCDWLPAPQSPRAGGGVCRSAGLGRLTRRSPFAPRTPLGARVPEGRACARLPAASRLVPGAASQACPADPSLCRTTSRDAGGRAGVLGVGGRQPLAPAVALTSTPHQGTQGELTPGHQVPRLSPQDPRHNSCAWSGLGEPGMRPVVPKQPTPQVLQVRGHLEGEAAFGHTQFPGEVGGGDRRALWPGRPAEAVPPRSGQGAHVPPHTDTPT